MNAIWLNLLVIILGLGAMGVERPELEMLVVHFEAQKILPHYQALPIKSSHQNKTEKNLHVADSFMAMVLIADVSYLAQSFYHYLPLYNLLQAKDYFLLI